MILTRHEVEVAEVVLCATRIIGATFMLSNQQREDVINSLNMEMKMQHPRERALIQAVMAYVAAED